MGPSLADFAVNYILSSVNTTGTRKCANNSGKSSLDNIIILFIIYTGNELCAYIILICYRLCIQGIIIRLLSMALVTINFNIVRHKYVRSV